MPNPAEKPCVIGGTVIAGAIRDPSTCVCGCLGPTEPCSDLGRCCDPTHDPFCCGGCGTRCLPDQGCCPTLDPMTNTVVGVCTTLNTDENCGSCGTNLLAPGTKPGWRCCTRPGSTIGEPHLIGTTNDCRDCFDKCPTGSEFCCPPDANHSSNWCDLPQSPQHCGRCNQAVACAAGQKCCETSTPGVFACTNVLNNPQHCGQCRIRCTTDQKCCSGTCTNIQNDPMNCSNCGIVCPAGQKCCSGTCKNVHGNDQMNCGDCGIVCPAGQKCCSGTCKNVHGNDQMNCGDCGIVCPAGRRCCPPGVCVNLQTDKNHCGMCNRPCPAGLDCCPGGQCFDLANDINHCGTCTGVCQPGHYTILSTGERVDYAAFCAAGTCTCPPGTYRCGGTDATAFCSPNSYPVCCAPTSTHGWHSCQRACGPITCND